jgi:hypothetical protein
MQDMLLSSSNKVLKKHCEKMCYQYRMGGGGVGMAKGISKYVKTRLSYGIPK